MIELQLRRPRFSFGQRSLTVAWSEPMENHGHARGVGACTVSYRAVEAVSVMSDGYNRDMTLLRVSWPGHSLVASMDDFGDLPDDFGPDEVAAALAAGYASGRERCQEIATRLREAMESA